MITQMSRELVLESTLPFDVGLVASRGGATRLSGKVRFVFMKDAAASGGFRIKTGFLLR